MAAFTKNDMKPKRTSCFFSNSGWNSLRRFMTAVMSASLNVVRMAAVCCDSTRREAMVRLSGLMRTTSSVRAPARTGAASVSAAGSAAVAGTSSFRTRPPGPLPSSAAASTPRSAASFAAAGMTWPAAGASAASAAAGAAASAGSAGVSATSPSSMWATASPISALSPSAFSSFTTVPEAGAGISSVALSVSISTTGSSRRTVSPSFFSHVPMNTSAIDSPTDGTLTSIAICFPSALQAGTGGGAGTRCFCFFEYFPDEFRLFQLVGAVRARCGAGLGGPAPAAERVPVQFRAELGQQEPPVTGVFRFFLDEGDGHVTGVPGERFAEFFVRNRVNLLQPDDGHIVEPTFCAFRGEFVIQLSGDEQHVPRVLHFPVGQDPPERAAAELGKVRNDFTVPQEALR